MKKSSEITFLDFPATILIPVIGMILAVSLIAAFEFRNISDQSVMGPLIKNPVFWLSTIIMTLLMLSNLFMIIYERRQKNNKVRILSAEYLKSSPFLNITFIVVLCIFLFTIVAGYSELRNRLMLINNVEKGSSTSNLTGIEAGIIISFGSLVVIAITNASGQILAWRAEKRSRAAAEQATAEMNLKIAKLEMEIKEMKENETKRIEGGRSIILPNESQKMINKN